MTYPGYSDSASKFGPTGSGGASSDMPRYYATIAAPAFRSVFPDLTFAVRMNMCVFAIGFLVASTRSELTPYQSLFRRYKMDPFLPGNPPNIGVITSMR